jgi:hypothetical protein
MIIIIATSEDDLQRAVYSLQDVASSFDMAISTDKAKERNQSEAKFAMRTL